MVAKKAEFPNADKFSSHGLCLGGCTFHFLCGIPGEVICLLGFWRSDAYLVYLDFPLETRTAACELMKLRIMALKQ